MYYVSMDWNTAHEFVDQANNVKWDGWDMEIFTPSPAAVFNKNGMQRNNEWGYKEVVSVNKDGTWKVPVRNARFNIPARFRR